MKMQLPIKVVVFIQKIGKLTAMVCAIAGGCVAVSYLTGPVTALTAETVAIAVANSKHQSVGASDSGDPAKAVNARYKGTYEQISNDEVIKEKKRQPLRFSVRLLPIDESQRNEGRAFVYGTADNYGYKKNSYAGPFLETPDWGVLNEEGFFTYTVPTWEEFRYFDNQPSTISISAINKAIEGKYELERDDNGNIKWIIERYTPKNVEQKYLGEWQKYKESFDWDDPVVKGVMGIYEIMGWVATNGYKTAPMIAFDEEGIGERLYQYGNDVNILINQINALNVPLRNYIKEQRRYGQGPIKGDEVWKYLDNFSDATLRNSWQAVFPSDTLPKIMKLLLGEDWQSGEAVVGRYEQTDTGVGLSIKEAYALTIEQEFGRYAKKLMSVFNNKSEFARYMPSVKFPARPITMFGARVSANGRLVQQTDPASYPKSLASALSGVYKDSWNQTTVTDSTLLGEEDMSWYKALSATSSLLMSRDLKTITTVQKFKWSENEASEETRIGLLLLTGDSGIKSRTINGQENKDWRYFIRKVLKWIMIRGKSLWDLLVDFEKKISQLITYDPLGAVWDLRTKAISLIVENRDEIKNQLNKGSDQPNNASTNHLVYLLNNSAACFYKSLDRIISTKSLYTKNLYNESTKKLLSSKKGVFHQVARKASNSLEAPWSSIIKKAMSNGVWGNELANALKIVVSASMISQASWTYSNEYYEYVLTAGSGNHQVKPYGNTSSQELVYQPVRHFTGGRPRRCKKREAECALVYELYREGKKLFRHAAGGPIFPNSWEKFGDFYTEAKHYAPAAAGMLKNSAAFIRNLSDEAKKDINNGMKSNNDYIEKRYHENNRRIFIPISASTYETVPAAFEILSKEYSVEGQDNFNLWGSTKSIFSNTSEFRDASKNPVDLKTIEKATIKTFGTVLDFAAKTAALLVPTLAGAVISMVVSCVKLVWDLLTTTSDASYVYWRVMENQKYEWYGAYKKELRILGIRINSASSENTFSPERDLVEPEPLVMAAQPSLEQMVVYFEASYLKNIDGTKEQWFTNEADVVSEVALFIAETLAWYYKKSSLEIWDKSEQVLANLLNH